MKITKNTLKKLIKEEMEAVLDEKAPQNKAGDEYVGPMKYYEKPKKPIYDIANDPNREGLLEDRLDKMFDMSKQLHSLIHQTYQQFFS